MPVMSLKERLSMNTILVAPAAFNMVSAKVIERAGFEAEKWHFRHFEF